MSGNTYENIHIGGSARVILGNEYTLESTELKILEWLSKLDPWTRHKEARDKYQAGTLDWFFEDANFLDWLDGKVQTLWCPGPPGTGKTILMSAIIEQLSRHLPNADAGVAFYYCQYQALETQSLAGILGCLLSQLYVRGADKISVPAEVSDVFSTRSKVSPTSDQLKRWLVQEVRSRERVLLLLDGLDEVNQDLREELLDSINLISEKNIQLLATSRDLIDIQNTLMDPVTLPIRAPDQSVDALITARINAPSGRRLQRLLKSDSFTTNAETTLELQIRKHITDTAEGMLLLPSLQLDIVLKSRTTKDILDSLATLPTTLDRYYDMTWERINGYEDDRDTTYAKTALSWVVHAFGPLLSLELRHAIAVSTSQSHDLKDSLLQEEDLYHLCAGLLKSSPDGRQDVAFAHFSAAEYFKSRATEYFPDAHDILARSCVRYLKIWLTSLPQPEYAEHAVDIRHTEARASFLSLPGRRVYRDIAGRFREIRRSFYMDQVDGGPGKRLVFLNYAHASLFSHAARGQPSQQDVLDLVRHNPELYAFRGTKISRACHPWQEPPCAGWIDLDSNFWRRFLAIHHNFDASIQLPDLPFSNDDHPILAQDLETRYSDMVFFWKRVDPRQYSTPLVNLLFSADLYFGVSECGTAEMRGILLEIVRLKYLGLPGFDGIRSKTLHLLLDATAIDIIKGSPVRLEQLINIGVIVNCADEMHKTALMYAVQAGHYAFAKQLLQRGANPESISSSGARALWYAYVSRRFDCLKLLVEYGADIAALRDDTVFSLPDIRIDQFKAGDKWKRRLKFTAYGPDKCWFDGLEYVVSTPECINEIWKARVEMLLEKPPKAWKSFHGEVQLTSWLKGMMEFKAGTQTTGDMESERKELSVSDVEGPVRKFKF